MANNTSTDQKLEAAAISARNRHTRHLLRLLLTTRPLTADQRDQLVRAASSIPVVTA